MAVDFHSNMPVRDIVVIGTSAGGIAALQTVFAGLPRDLPAAVFVVIHMSPDTPSVLPRLLERAGPLPVHAAVDGEPVRGGNVYVASPDHHLLIEDGRVRVARGPKENRHRPSVDPLFRSAAVSYGRRVIGVVMTGALDDGTAGLRTIKQRGGLALVQDPAEADFPSMPRSAIENVAVDRVLPLREIPVALAELAGKPVDGTAPPDAAAETEALMATGEPESTDKLGKPSAFGCPECGGVLWEIDDAQLLRFRCRVGHAYSADSLVVEQTEGVEDALWAALRAL